ncbi:MAG: glycoside hydrolase family 25 protein, partial [Lachnospiraceae bacterium]|nr:glycoside hydrolase family 25 protein [Lachnospiraceae bacterium]
IIRCGFRGSASGRMVEDSFFRRNIEGAIAEGIDVGVYFFTQAINEKEAIEEADMVLALCKEYELDYPMFIDTEKGPNGRANGLDKETRTRVIKAFCERITEAGHRAGVYASTSWYRNQLNAKELEQYCIWVAQYNVECTYKGKADYWQYTSKGQIAGIEGYVDMDIILRP